MPTVRVDIPTCHSTPFHSDTAVQEHCSSLPPPQLPQPLRVSTVSSTVLRGIAQPCLEDGDTSCLRPRIATTYNSSIVGHRTGVYEHWGTTEKG